MGFIVSFDVIGIECYSPFPPFVYSANNNNNLTRKKNMKRTRNSLYQPESPFIRHVNGGALRGIHLENKET